jgi:hypothetical protein
MGLIDANGSQHDPDAPSSEHELGSDGVPCVMVTSSFVAPYGAWTKPQILIDAPVGDAFPTHDANGWDQFGAATFLSSLLDVAPGGQYPGGAASKIYIADCELPRAR